MRYIPIELFRSDKRIPKKVRRVVRAVERDLGRDLEAPLGRIEGVESDCKDADGENLIIHVLVAPGLVLPYEHSDENELYLEEAEDYIVGEIHSGVMAVRLNVDRYAAAAEEVRSEAKRAVAEWQADGLPCDLVAVQMEQHQGWYNGSEPGFHVVIGGLGDRLERSCDTVFVQNASEFRAKAEWVRSRQHRRNERRILCGRQGADGSIDETAVLALRAYDRPEEVFALLRDADRVLLGNGSVLLWTDGHIWCGHDAESDGVSCHLISDRMEARGIVLDEAGIRSAVGLPASSVFAHPLLTHQVRIASIEMEEDECGLAIHASLIIPAYLFCSGTGRTWSPDAPIVAPKHFDAGVTRSRPSLRVV